MAGFNPNFQQKRAIDIRDRNVFVSAAAGSGKTRAMTERFAAAVIKDNIPVDRILTITFTKEAAAQLQDKIKNRLQEAGFVGESRKVPDAYISTIHSFCSRILRAHPFDAGVDPNFTVLEDVTAKTIVKDALNQSLDLFSKAGLENRRFVYQVGRDNLSRTLLSLHDALRSAGFIEPADGIPQADLKSQDKSTIKALIDDLLNELNDALTDAKPDPAKKTYFNNFSVALDLLTYLDIHGYDILPGLGERFKFNMAAGISKEVFGRSKELIDTIDHILAEDLAYRYHGFYSELLRLFSTTYREQKALVSGLDFEDLQLLTKQLLERHDEIREGYRQKFKLIMVDEFQDTNRLQFDIIDRIVDNNLFTVGDEFQSIYQFRHADVSVFRGLRKRVQMTSGEPVEFPENFRSREELISFVNRIGSSPKFFGDEHLHLKAGRLPDSFKRTDGPAIELAIIDNKWQDFKPASAEADFIAGRISEIIAGGIYDLNDIAILIPKRTKLREIENALKLRGIRHYTVGGTGYYSTDEVAEIKDILATLVNPYDDLSLIGVLRGPCVRLSDDALYLIRKASGRINESDAPLWQAIIDKSVFLEKPDEEKLKRFIEVFNGLRKHAAYSGLSSIIEMAISETGYDLCTIMRDHNGILRYANIRKLMRLADAYEDIHGPDLAGFVDYLSAQKDLSSQECEAALINDDLGAVRIMTVHAAKGLQFPAVFLALSKSGPTYSAPGSSEMVLFRAARGEPGGGSDASIAFKVAGVNGAFETPGYLGLKGDIKLDTDEEDKRLLHVALTRAEEYLSVTGICNIDKKDPVKSENNTYIEWLMAALGVDHHEVRDRRDAHLYDWHDSGVDFRIVCEDGASIIVDRSPVGLTGDMGIDEGVGQIELPVIDLRPVVLVSGPHIRELSYTSIETYIKCPHRFYLQNIVGVKAGDFKAPGGTENAPLDAASFGTIVHEILEGIDIASLTENGLPAAIDGIESVFAAYPGLNKAGQERFFGIIEEFGKSSIAGRIAKAKQIKKEVPFSFLLDGIIISGRIDDLAIEDSGVLVVDYKTGNTGVGLKALEKKYRLQMDVYGLGLLKSGAGKVEVAVVGLENGIKVTGRTYTHQDIEACESRLMAIVGDINRNDQNWPFSTDNGTCNYCGVARFCRRKVSERAGAPRVTT